MIVSRSSFDSTLEALCAHPGPFSFDTETTGLRPYHGDRLFALIISEGANDYYFNFWPYEGLGINEVLSQEHLRKLEALFKAPEKVWFAHNAKFDLAFLSRDGIEVSGTIHCTKAQARVLYNEHLSYSLDSCLSLIGLSKDDTVEKYIKEHKLTEKRVIPGKSVQETKKLFYKVPFDIIVPYGCRDASGTYQLGVHQRKELKVPGSHMLMCNEESLTKTVFEMEKRGVLLDAAYTRKAILFEESRIRDATRLFKTGTGRDYLASNKLFSEVFTTDRTKWKYTEKGNPSFDSNAIKDFENPVAKTVLEIRDAKSRADFYNGFLYHADERGIIHPTFNPDGAAHGRFSSSNPNLQNLTSEPSAICQRCQTHTATYGIIECECGGAFEQIPFIIRRALIPRPNHVFIMVDYDQMEYRLMLEIACKLIGRESSLVALVKSGLDVHQATAHVASETGVKITREEAKTVNFLSLYGGGVKKLAAGLKCDEAQARTIQNAIFKAAPEIKHLINQVQSTAESRGYIRNWIGRRCYFPDKNKVYRAPNYLIAGGCADIVKLAMNQIDAYLKTYKSRLVLTIHDELVVEVHKDEIEVVPREVKKIMEEAFKSEYLPLTCGIEWSDISLGDKKKGYPV